jgi:hypothetical protein
VPVLIVCGLLTGLAADTPTGNIQDTAVEFVRLFSRGGLSVHTALDVLGTDAHAERQGVYWTVSSERRSTQMVLRIDRDEVCTDDAELLVERRVGLTLRDLESVFGRWELVFSSKTSAVKFRIHDDPSAKPILAFAKLFTAKPLPDSPVISLRLRSDLPAARDRR